VTAIAAPAITSRYVPAVSGVDRAIRVSTAAVVLAVAGIAAYISYWHAYAVVREYGETGHRPARTRHDRRPRVRVQHGHLVRRTAPSPGP